MNESAADWMDSRQNIAALILAAGYSSRMPDFKPLLPLGETTALARAIWLFESCGLADIRVVTGHRAGELDRIICRTAARPVFNPRYAEGMFSSVAAGVRALTPDCRAFFILPVDVALVRPGTVATLLGAWAKTGQGICYPCFDGRRGHPPLIGAALIPDILRWQGAQGLHGCLKEKEHLAVDVAVADESILLDMDTAESYAHLLERWGRHEIPTAAECRALMQDVYQVPPAVWNHCQAVARVAVGIGAALDRAGLKLDLGLIQAAGLTHDIARRQEAHAAAGARLLADLGFPAVADIVAVHMDIAVGADEALDERQVVHLADKLVAGDQATDLALRFEGKLKKYGHEPAAAAAIARRRDQAMRIKARIEKAVGGPLEKILANKPNKPNKLNEPNKLNKPNKPNEPNEPNELCEA